MINGIQTKKLNYLKLKLYNKDFVRDRTEGFDNFLKEIERQDVESSSSEVESPSVESSSSEVVESPKEDVAPVESNSEEPVKIDPAAKTDSEIKSQSTSFGQSGPRRTIGRNK